MKKKKKKVDRSKQPVPGPQGLDDFYSTWSVGRAVMYGRHILAFIVVFKWIYREMGSLENPLERKAFSASQVSLFWEKWLHQFNRAPLNFRDHPSAPCFYRGFHVRFPSPAVSACFPSEISTMWQLMCHWDPVDSCQPPHLEANCQDGKQQASFPADKNTNMNCYYYYPIFRLSNQPQLFNPSPLPRGMSIEEPRACKSVLFIYIKSKY